MSFKIFNFDRFFEFDFKRVSFKTIKSATTLKIDLKDNNMTFNMIIELILSNDFQFEERKMLLNLEIDINDRLQKLFNDYIYNI